MASEVAIGNGSRPVGIGTYVLLAAVGVCLVAGYVVLSALGRDTTGYVLFLGGPVVTSLVGAILSRRVGHVEAAVSESTGQTNALVAAKVSDLDGHLDQQDQALADLAQVADVDERPPPPPSQQVPAARERPPSPFGPVSTGLIPPRR